MYFANCHNHSTFSDGVYTPERMVELAAKAGYGAIVLTDHDTVRGTYFLQKAARRAGLLSLLGCEFSTKYRGVGFHLVGFDFNPDFKPMQELLAYASARQTKRSKLLFDWGLERGTLREGITWQDVLDYAPDNDYFCNNQVFDCMVARGIYRELEYDAFLKSNFAVHHLGISAQLDEALNIPYPALEDVVRIIKEAGGVPVIAHPHRRAEYLDELLSMGVMGFETRHPDLTADECKFYDRVCEEHRLYRCGGTDHSGILGGLMEKMPAEHAVGPERGYMTEESFMQLYRRTLG